MTMTMATATTRSSAAAVAVAALLAIIASESSSSSAAAAFAPSQTAFRRHVGSSSNGAASAASTALYSSASAGAVAEDTETDTETETASAQILWEPDPDSMKDTAMHKFMVQSAGLDEDSSYDDLWKWSVSNSDTFWKSLLDFVGVVYSGSPDNVREGDKMPDVTYFPDVRLNFAENLLKHGEPSSELRDAEALVGVSESYEQEDSSKRWTFGELRDDASRIASALAALGVSEHDACGAYMPNVAETVVAMLGCSSTGATWSSCSQDFGARAVADRFGQIGPKVLFTVDGFTSKNEEESIAGKVEELVEALPSLEKVVVLNLLKKEKKPEWTSPKMKELAISYEDFLASGSDEDGSAPEPNYVKVPFSHPQFVLYSSGTTGLPKSIAHGAGNVLLAHAKELILHSDLRPNDRMLFFTTCGWMMWNWMTSSLFAGAAVVTFDGFAAYPKMSSPWDLIERERITHMGTTPRYLQACRKRVRPGEDNDLSRLRVIFSTGSPLLPEDFDYVYDKVKGDVMLASISGGTDICSCFVLGNPLLPVRKGELTAFGLGLDACALDKETDERVVGGKGAKAELACRSPFVSAPVRFFGDDENMSKYRDAYFDQEKDDGVWYHGDLVEVTGSVGESGGVVIHGRSDTTLKPGGVRIGTAEVYRFAEDVDAVRDSLVIGDQIRTGRRKGDVRIVLFVQLSDDDDDDAAELTPELQAEIKSAIREGASDAHVPALIKRVRKIPYTRSGKKVELAVRDLFMGVEPRNVGALQDPTAFEEYRKMAEEGL